MGFAARWQTVKAVRQHALQAAMSECHAFEDLARRAFVVTPYAADAAGVMVASRPLTCLRHEAGDAPCSLWVDHQRIRKTGPCYPLTVMRCGRHHRAFTLYPPGHVPYGRIAVAPVSSSGALIKDVPSAQDTPEEAPIAQASWTGTVFGAALDAAAGRAWPRKHAAGCAYWRTQGRRLTRGARLVGIAPMTDGALRHREQMARRLAVPTLVLVEQSGRWKDARGYRERGAAIVVVLAEMKASRALSDRLMFAGELEGMWGRASHWDSASQVLRRSPFS